MSDKQAEEKKAEPSEAKPQPAREKRRKAKKESIYLVPYPKVIFFYPAFLTALVLAVWMVLTNRNSVDADDRTAVVMTWIFLGIFAVNLFVITFDFPRATSLTMLFLVAALVMGGVLLFTFHPELIPQVTEILLKMRPLANATFYIVFASVFTVIYVAVVISTRFNYWEVRPNELLHHHGVLSDLKRYSAPSLRVDKEINDVFEYLLLRSGRLILHPSSERKAITLENVLFIHEKEKAITGMLGALQVQVRTDDR